MTPHPHARHRAEHGSAALELVVLTPALLAVLLLVLAAGRLTTAAGQVDAAARDAARAASLARTLPAAQTAAQHTATADLTGTGLHCQDSTVIVRGDYTAGPGVPASVTVTVGCTVDLHDLALPGLPGTKTLSSTYTAVLDTYRGPPRRHPVTGRLGRRHRPRGDTGSLTLFAAVMVLALLVVAGLVVDGAATLTATRRANHLAEQAARAGARAADTTALHTGAVRLDPTPARAAALAYLHAASPATGTTAGTAPYDITVTVGPDAVTVALRTTTATAFLGLLGIHTLPVTGQGRASLLAGISQEQP